MRKAISFKTAIVAVLTALWAVNAGANGPKKIDIPAGDLAVALASLAKQSGVELMYSAEQVKGLQTAGIHGEYTAEMAAAKLLEGTRLKLKVHESGGLLISDAGDVEAGVHRSLQGGAAEQMRMAEAEGQASQVTHQDGAEDANERPSRSSDSSTAGAKLEEIIVTATKRAENVQDVPVSIAVVTAEDIDRRGLVSSRDYLRGIPGVNQMEGSQGQSIIIRGLETSTTHQNISHGGTVATYFGETPTTGTVGVTAGGNIDLKLVDIERVEVLRGPQGTAFGSASMGGAVRTIPVAPKLDRVEGKVGAGYSSTSDTGGDNYNFQAVVNFPLMKDKLAVRAVAYRYEDTGYYVNRAGSDAAYREAVAAFGGQTLALDENDMGTARYVGGRLSALFQATDDLKFTLSYLNQQTETDGFAGANSGTYEQTVLQVAPEHRRRGETGPLFDTDIDIANALMEYDLGWANLLATYSHTKSGSAQPAGFSIFGPDLRTWPLSFTSLNEQRSDFGEVRLVSQLDGKWNFVTGLYYEDTEDEGIEDYIWDGDPATFLGERYLGAFLDQRTLTQKAAFGEVSWEFVPGFTLTGGVRTYDYDRTYKLDAGGGPFYPPAGVHSSADVNASGETFRASLSYKGDNTLLYGGWSEGFRLGRPQVGPPADACDLDGDGIIDNTSVALSSLETLSSDGVDNYEIGGKFSLLDRRVSIDAAVFRMDWSDIPFGAIPGGVVTTECSNAMIATNSGAIANVGSARSEGVEAQAYLQVNPAFRLGLGGSYIRAELTDDAPAVGLVAGTQLPGAPEVNANLGLQYDFAIGSHAASVRADAIYVGEFNIAVLPPGTPVEGNQAGDYVKLDASARFTLGEIKLDVYVQNLTNEDAYSSRGFVFIDDPYYGMRLRPRTIGLQFGYDF